MDSNALQTEPVYIIDNYPTLPTVQNITIKGHC